MSVSVGDIAPHVDPERLVDRLRDLVRTPSENPPGREAEVAKRVQEYCDDLGLNTSIYEYEPGRPSVLARWGSGAHPVLCYCSHIDVVPAGDPTLWAHDPYGAEIHDGYMHGRGSSDAKGPVSASLEAVSALQSAGFTPRGTIAFAFVADEETMGLKGAKPLVESGTLQSDMAIVGEPTSLRIVRAQRGPCWFRIIARGVAGHGSAPERGVNAIKHMSEIILHLEETLPDISHPIVGGPSINVGTISGGEKVNVIPALCVAEIDRRTIPGETEDSVREQIETAIELAKKRFPEIDARVEIPVFGEPFESDENSSVVKEMSRATEEARARPPEIIGFRGSSDARFFAEAGAEVAICGPGDITVAHTARESIDLEELRMGAIAYALAFARLSGGRDD
jgi:succinyl-diaminopimelate desuccinylase